MSKKIPHFLVHSPNDNVGVVVVEDLKKGTNMIGVITEDHSTTKSSPSMTSRSATRWRSTNLKKGDTVIKYGVDIGMMAGDAKKGDHVHVHNLKTKKWWSAMAKSKNAKKSNLSFMGWRRENERVGVRNHVILLPLDDLSNAACEAVANNIKGTIALPHAYGRLQFGADLDLHFRTLIGTGSNPNVAAVIVIGIEDGWTGRVVDGIAKTGKPVTGFGIEATATSRPSRRPRAAPRTTSNGRPSCRAKSAASKISGSRRSAAKATPPPASAPVRRSATCTTS